MLECLPLPLNISLLHFFFWEFKENNYAGDAKTIRGLKDATVSELISQAVNKSLTDLGMACLPAVTLRKRAEKGPFTLNSELMECRRPE